MRERLTPPASLALSRAGESARRARRPKQLPRYLLSALASNRGSGAARLLQDAGVAAPPPNGAYQVEMLVVEQEPSGPEIPKEARELVERARQLADEMNHPLIGSEHLLVVALEMQEARDWEPIRVNGLSAQEARQQLFGA
jgi:ATP-dependent Clp protease ATP-binding subunit ClpA